MFKQIKSRAKESENILQRFKFSQQMMENLINDLLDLAKLENNQFTLTNEYFNLQHTIFKALQMLQFMASQNEIELKAVIDKRIHLNLIQLMIGDEKRYLQMLLNFLSNALKFTDKGGCITIKIDIEDHQLVNENTTPKHLVGSLLTMNDQQIKNQGYKDFDDFVKQNIKFNKSTIRNIPLEDGQQRYVKMRLSIIDTGIGISEEGQKHLFIDFSKLNENSKRNS